MSAKSEKYGSKAMKARHEKREGASERAMEYGPKKAKAKAKKAVAKKKMK